MAKPAETVGKAIAGLQASLPLLEGNEKAGEILSQIEALTAALEAFNTENCANAAPKAAASLTYKSGAGFIDKPGGCFTITFKAKPTTSDTDLGKLTGRVKALFMAVPKEMKHLMKTSTYAHADGLKRWSIEVKFPFATLNKANQAAGEYAQQQYVTQGIAAVKEYLESNKNPEAVPFNSSVQFDFDCSALSLIQYFDPAGEYRAQVNQMAGPEADVPKQVEGFHKELLKHVDMVDSVSLKTPEREICLNLGSLRLADLFSPPSEEVAKVEVDPHPAQEMVGALGLGILGGAVALTDKILYRNDVTVEKTVENTTPAEVGLEFEDVVIETQDGVTLQCWLVKCADAGCPTVLYFHGNAGDMASRLDHVKSLQGTLNCNVFMVSYRGYGKSSSKPSEDGFMEDALASLKYLADNPAIDSSKIVVFGHSVGGAVAIHLAAAAEVKPAAVIVENTFTSIAEMVGPLFRRVGDWLPSKWKNHEKVQEVTSPILFLSGRSDTIVPPEMMDLLKNAATSAKEAKLVEFPTQGHNDTMDGEGYADAIKAFVTEHVR